MKGYICLQFRMNTAGPEKTNNVKRIYMFADTFSRQNSEEYFGSKLFITFGRRAYHFRDMCENRHW